MSARPILPSRISSSGPPAATLGRMILAPLVLCFRRLNIPLPTNLPTSPSHLWAPLSVSLAAAVQRFDRSVDPRDTFRRIQLAKLGVFDVLPLVFMAVAAGCNLYIMAAPLLFKLFLITAYITTAIIPFTGQFVWPASPVFSWLLTFFTARYIPSDIRPRIHVALLPALESVLYGANISDLQTRFTHPVLDVLSWLPYGLLHFSVPFVVAFTLWAAGPRGAIKYFGKAFGWMNFTGVVTQLVFPCAAPWYEIIHGLTPADYSMAGSPGGLLRIDRVFGIDAYTNAFSTAPLVFGAFPSLHSGCAVMDALFLAHFFPRGKVIYWTYVGLLWWSTMYLSHHYLIDLVGGACLSVAFFYATMPEQFKDSDQIDWKAGLGEEGYEMLREQEHGHDVDGHGGDGVDGEEGIDGDVDLDEEIRKLEESDGPRSGREEEERERGKKVTFGQTSVMV